MSLAECRAGDDRLHDRGELPMIGLDPSDDSVDRRSIVQFESAADRIREQVLREGPDKDLRVVQELIFQADNVRKRQCAEQFTAGVDLKPRGVAVTPAADSVVVLQNEAERIDPRMAGRARGVRLVLLQSLVLECSFLT